MKKIRNDVEKVKKYKIVRITFKICRELVTEGDKKIGLNEVGKLLGSIVNAVPYYVKIVKMEGK